MGCAKRRRGLPVGAMIHRPRVAAESFHRVIASQCSHWRARRKCPWGMAIRSLCNAFAIFLCTFGGAPHQRPLCVKGAALNWGPRRSPTKWVRWGKEESPKGISFGHSGVSELFAQRRKRSSRTLRRRDWGIAPQRLVFICGFRLGAVRFLDMEQSEFALQKVNCVAAIPPVSLRTPPPFTQGRLWCSATLLMQ